MIEFEIVELRVNSSKKLTSSFFSYQLRDINDRLERIYIHIFDFNIDENIILHRYDDKTKKIIKQIRSG